MNIDEIDFVASDLHLAHYNIALHTSRMPWIYANPNYDSSKKFHFKYNNPWAVDVKAHDEAIIENWNKIVPKKARVIILGDFAYKNHKYFIQALNGKSKIFVMGNHDKANNDFYNVFNDKTVDPNDLSQIRRECSSILKRFRNGDMDFNDSLDGILSTAWSRFVELQDWEMADQMSIECMNLFDNVHELGYRTQIQGQDVTFCHYKMSAWASSCHASWNIFGHSHGRMPDFDNVLACDADIGCWGFAPAPWCAIVKKMQIKIEWMNKNGKYPVDGENKAEGQYDKDPETRVIEVRKKNKDIMKSMGYPIIEDMWPTERVIYPS